MRKPEAKLVQTQSALDEASRELAGAERIYLDTEFESTRDGTTLCLLQLSRGGTIFLVDSLRLPALDPLRPVLDSPNTEWVLHAGQQDVALVAARVGLKNRPTVFDTQVAWALLGPEYSVSLAYLQYRLLGIRSGKAHQADDWKRRPLPASQLSYAASDIEHLPKLRNLLHERVARFGREQMVIEASRETIWPEPEATPPLTLESFRNAWQLDRKNQAALKALIDWHNGLDPAKRRLAPEPKTLLSIANRLPENAGELGRIKGVSRSFCQQWGNELVARLVRAVRESSEGDFAVIEAPPYATFEEIRLDALLGVARAEICAALQVAPELALPGRVLRPIKASLLARPDVRAALEYLKGWREALLGQKFIEFFERNPLPQPAAS